MPESERLARLDELAAYEIWCQSHDPAQYMDYLAYRSKQLNDSRAKGLGRGRLRKINLTRASLLDLLTTMKRIGYGNQNMAQLEIDIIVYRMEAIWKGVKHNAHQ
jgi:hypothetical protein